MAPVADHHGGLGRPLVEQEVDAILQARGDAPVVLGRDEDEGVEGRDRVGPRAGVRARVPVLGGDLGGDDGLVEEGEGVVGQVEQLEGVRGWLVGRGGGGFLGVGRGGGAGGRERVLLEGGSDEVGYSGAEARVAGAAYQDGDSFAGHDGLMMVMVMVLYGSGCGPCGVWRDPGLGGGGDLGRGAWVSSPSLEPESGGC